MQSYRGWNNLFDFCIISYSVCFTEPYFTVCILALTGYIQGVEGQLLSAHVVSPSMNISMTDWAVTITWRSPSSLRVQLGRTEGIKPIMISWKHHRNSGNLRFLANQNQRHAAALDRTTGSLCTRNISEIIMISGLFRHWGQAGIHRQGNGNILITWNQSAPSSVDERWTCTIQNLGLVPCGCETTRDVRGHHTSEWRWPDGSWISRATCVFILKEVCTSSCPGPVAFRYKLSYGSNDLAPRVEEQCGRIILILATPWAWFRVSCGNYKLCISSWNLDTTDAWTCVPLRLRAIACKSSDALQLEGQTEEKNIPEWQEWQYDNMCVCRWQRI